MNIQSFIKEEIAERMSPKVIESAITRALDGLDIEDVLIDALQGKIEDCIDDYVIDAIYKNKNRYTKDIIECFAKGFDEFTIEVQTK